MFRASSRTRTVPGPPSDEAQPIVPRPSSIHAGRDHDVSMVPLIRLGRKRQCLLRRSRNGGLSRLPARSREAFGPAAAVARRFSTCSAGPANHAAMMTSRLGRSAPDSFDHRIHTDRGRDRPMQPRERPPFCRPPAVPCRGDHIGLGHDLFSPGNCCFGWPFEVPIKGPVSGISQSIN